MPTSCKTCADTVSKPGAVKTKELEHPDHSDSLNRLRRIQGQLSGIERMILEKRYCFDILTQFRAASSALQAVESSVFERHLKMCVREALESKNVRAAEAKIQELLTLLKKRPPEMIS